MIDVSLLHIERAKKSFFLINLARQNSQHLGKTGSSPAAT